MCVYRLAGAEAGTVGEVGGGAVNVEEGHRGGVERRGGRRRRGGHACQPVDQVFRLPGSKFGASTMSFNYTRYPVDKVFELNKKKC
jgi:hypothetical protein